MRTGWPQREAFMEFVDEHRKRSGYRTDYALAEAAGLSHTTISSWRHGRQRPNLENIQKIADALSVPAHAMAEIAGVVDPARFGTARPATPEQDETRYTDPITGETYAEQWERDLWDLNRLDMEERRKLIFFTRSERERQQAEQRRAAG